MVKVKWILNLVMASALIASPAWAQQAGGRQGDSMYSNPNTQRQGQQQQFKGGQGAQTSQSGMQQQGAGNVQQQSMMNPSELVGNVLWNATGDKLGTITEVLERNGKIQYLIVRGQDGENLYPVPWQTVHVNRKIQYGLSLNTPKGSLEGNPRIDSVAELQDPDVNREVYGYYGVGPEVYDNYGIDPGL